MLVLHLLIEARPNNPGIHRPESVGAISPAGRFTCRLRGGIGIESEALSKDLIGGKRAGAGLENIAYDPCDLLTAHAIDIPPIQEDAAFGL